MNFQSNKKNEGAGWGTTQNLLPLFFYDQDVVVLLVTDLF